MLMARALILARAGHGKAGKGSSRSMRWLYTLLVVAIVLGAYVVRVEDRALARRLAATVDRIASHRCAPPAIAFLVTIALATAMLARRGPPLPGVWDEFSYLL